MNTKKQLHLSENNFELTDIVKIGKKIKYEYSIVEDVKRHTLHIIYKIYEKSEEEAIKNYIILIAKKSRIVNTNQITAINLTDIMQQLINPHSESASCIEVFDIVSNGFVELPIIKKNGEIINDNIMLR